MKREIIQIKIDDTVPTMEQILTAQGVPVNAASTDRIRKLADQAISAYLDLAEPIGVVASVLASDFEEIYRGEGLNAALTPLDGIVKQAEALCLFAVTVGSNISGKITELFDGLEFALASMLDSAASEGTENAAQRIEDHYAEHLKSISMLDSTRAVLRFSPGYCGWHVGAQRKLFQCLQPEDIGILLTDSFLMQPLKSISGVIISGEKTIFGFEDTYPFCSECTDHSCIERLRSMMKS